MLKLENIQKDLQIRGLAGQDEIVRIVMTEWVGEEALTVYYTDSQGRFNEQMLCRADEARLERAQIGRPWALDAPGAEFKLGLEAYRNNKLYSTYKIVPTGRIECS